jgi:hypothetical protein
MRHQVSRRRDCAKRGEQEHVYVCKAGAARPCLPVSSSPSHLATLPHQSCTHAPLSPPSLITMPMPVRALPLPNALQGWITAAEESSAVRISASDGFDLTACVAPKPQPPPLKPRPQSAAPAELKNPYRGMMKEGKIAWVRAAPHPSLVHLTPHAGAQRHNSSRQKRMRLARGFSQAVRHARRQPHRQAVRVRRSVCGPIPPRCMFRLHRCL